MPQWALTSESRLSLCPWRPRVSLPQHTTLGGSGSGTKVVLQCSERYCSLCSLSRNELWDDFTCQTKQIYSNILHQTHKFVLFFNTFRSVTKVLVYVNLLRLEYSVINHFLIMFLITYQVYSFNSSNKEPQPCVRTLCKQKTGWPLPQIKSKMNMWREESKLWPLGSNKSNILFHTVFPRII